MVMALDPKTIDPQAGSFNPQNAGGLPSAGDAATGTNKHLARALQIATVMQTTLDVEEVVQLFSREMAITIPHTSVAFDNTERDVHITVGTPGEYRYTYKLVVHESDVGEIAFTRETELAANQTIELEYLLCAVIYPLLNALKYKAAQESSVTDPLTGLFNRTGMETSMHRELKLAQRHRTPLSLLVIDIDDFKAVNDQYGHATGDSVLKCVAENVTGCVRDTDVVSRFGGEEFTVLLSNTDAPGAILLADRIRQRVAEAPCSDDSNTLGVTISIGVTSLRKGDTESSFFERADAALYQAKHEGKNRACQAPLDDTEFDSD